MGLFRYFLVLPLALAVLAGCSSMGPKRDINSSVQAQKAAVEIPEQQLLDVWIELFDAGELPAGKQAASGLTMEIRQAEARYLPEHLRASMEKTGYWGAVRVVPRGAEGSEVLVRGTILASDGDKLELAITAQDASGRQWFSATYAAETTVASYQAATELQQEVFQSLFNTIANDLAEYRSSLAPEEILAIRRIAALRFAADLAPDAFAGYLQRSEEGHYTIQHLPAAGDLMYRRVNAIRERDFLLIDTLNGHFNNFYREMQTPYNEWRMARSEEVAAMREIKKSANKRKFLGAAAILGAIAIEVFGNDRTRSSTGTLRDVMVLGGAMAVKSGFDKASEATIHREAIKELGDSFAAETRPLVVEVEGETHELTGSAEVQYTKWRSLLKRIYASETGLTATTD